LAPSHPSIRPSRSSRRALGWAKRWAKTVAPRPDRID
jgi:hypothetical protein